MTTILRWSRLNMWVNHGNFIGSTSYISTPRLRRASRCLFLSGRLLELFPKESYKVRTSTPCSAFSASNSKRARAMESLRKLKYSKCTLDFACLIAENMSWNFSVAAFIGTTLLSCENVTPAFLNVATTVLSTVCPQESVLHIRATANVIHLICLFPVSF